MHAMYAMYAMSAMSFMPAISAMHAMYAMYAVPVCLSVCQTGILGVCGCQCVYICVCMHVSIYSPIHRSIYLSVSVCVCVKHLNRCKTSIWLQLSSDFWLVNFTSVLFVLSVQQGDTAFHWDCVQRSYQ